MIWFACSFWNNTRPLLNLESGYKWLQVTSTWTLSNFYSGSLSPNKNIRQNHKKCYKFVNGIKNWPEVLLYVCMSKRSRFHKLSHPQMVKHCPNYLMNRQMKRCHFEFYRLICTCTSDQPSSSSHSLTQATSDKEINSNISASKAREYQRQYRLRVLNGPNAER